MSIKATCPKCKNIINMETYTTKVKCPYCKSNLTMSPRTTPISVVPMKQVSYAAKKQNRLMLCPDCNREVSRSAEFCPHCGCPFEIVNQPEKVQVIEQTSKFWKLQIMLASAIVILGMFFVCAGLFNTQHTNGGNPILAILGFLIFFGGFIWFVIARACAWWNHG